MTTNVELHDARLSGDTDTVIDRRFLEPHIETASRDDIAKLQERRILELVDYAWTHSALYREHWSQAGVSPADIGSVEDFVRRIPTITKADIQTYRDRTGDPYGGLLCVDPCQITSITSTSGTTSLPEPIPEIWTTAPPLPTISARDLWEIGVRPGDRVIMPTGTLRNYFDDFFHMLGLVPIFVDTWVGEGERVLQAIERHQVTYLQFMLPLVMEFERLEARYDMRTMLDIIWARPNAFAALEEHQPRVLPFVRLGPALAMGRPGGSTALVNADEWDVVETADGLIVSGVADRAATFRDVVTGFRGTATRLGDEITVNLAAEPT